MDNVRKETGQDNKKKITFPLFPQMCKVVCYASFYFKSRWSKQMAGHIFTFAHITRQ